MDEYEKLEEELKKVYEVITREPIASMYFILVLVGF